MIRKIIYTYLSTLCIVIATFSLSQTVHANEWTQGIKAFKLATKNGAKLSGDIPDGFYRNFYRKMSKKANDVTTNSASKLAKTIKAIRKQNPSLAKEILQLQPKVQKVVLNAYQGAKVLSKNVSSPVVRTRILKENGANALLLLSKHKDSAAKSLMRLDGAIQSGKLQRTAAKDFSTYMSSANTSAWNAWNKHILPNWKKLLAAGFIASFIAEPDFYIDAAGDFTEDAMTKLSELGVEVIVRAGEGIVQGAGYKINEKLSGPDAIYLWVGLALFGTLFLIIIFRKFFKR